MNIYIYNMASANGPKSACRESTWERIFCYTGYTRNKRNEKNDCQQGDPSKTITLRVDLGGKVGISKRWKTIGHTISLPPIAFKVKKGAGFVGLWIDFD